MPDPSRLKLWQVAGVRRMRKARQRDSMSDTTAYSIATPVATFELRSWTDRDWSGGVELARLAGLDRFMVRTRNTNYEFTVLCPETGDVLVRGGRFFPVQTRARVAGCTLGGSCLKVHAIYPGFLMELLHGGQRIVTSSVQRIAPLPAGTPQ